MLTRRQMIVSALTAVTAGGAWLKKARAQSEHSSAAHGQTRSRKVSYTPVVTPNGSTLPYKIKNGVKEFHLIAEPVEREFAPGMKVKC